MRHEQIKAAIRRFEYFKNFSEEKITECCSISRINQYGPQETIFSQDDISNFSYFVLCGKAMILQCLKFRKKSNGMFELIVAKKKPNALEIAMSAISTCENHLTSITGLESDEKSSYVEQHQFVDVGTFSIGAVFGINEEMENRLIIARTMVQCLLVPRYWLFQKPQNIGNVWQRIKLFLNSSVPSQQKLFENFLANRKWKKYKKKTVDQIKREYKISDPETQFYNIPLICRIEES